MGSKPLQTRIHMTPLDRALCRRAYVEGRSIGYLSRAMHRESPDIQTVSDAEALGSEAPVLPEDRSILPLPTPPSGVECIEIVRHLNST